VVAATRIEASYVGVIHDLVVKPTDQAQKKEET